MRELSARRQADRGRAYLCKQLYSQMSACGPALQGHGFPINKSHFTRYLKSKIKDSSHWVRPFHLKQVRLTLSKKRQTTFPPGVAWMGTQTRPRLTRGGTRLEKHRSKPKYHPKASHADSRLGFVTEGRKKLKSFSLQQKVQTGSKLLLCYF